MTGQLNAFEIKGFDRCCGKKKYKVQFLWSHRPTIGKTIPVHDKAGPESCLVNGTDVGTDFKEDGS